MHPILAALKQAAQEHPDYDEAWMNGIADWMDRAQKILDGPATRFEDFWKVYPRKVSKQAAYAAWRRVQGDTHADAIIKAVQLRLRTGEWELTLERRHFIPHATTFLNQRRWLDEPEGGPGKRGGDQHYMRGFVG